MIFWEEIPHLGGKGWSSYKRVSLPDEKKEAVIWTEWRKAFPGSLSFVRSYLKELIPTSPFTKRPSSCRRQKHEHHPNTTFPSEKVQRSMQHRWNVSNLSIGFFFFFFFSIVFFFHFFLKIIYFTFTLEEASLQQLLSSSKSRDKIWRQTKPLPGMDQPPAAGLGSHCFHKRTGWPPQKAGLQHWSLIEIWQVLHSPCLSFPVWGVWILLFTPLCKGLCHLHCTHPLGHSWH